MKKHNIVKVVLITMLVFLLLSWIFPAAYYSGQYVEQGRVQMGLFDIFNYPITALQYFGYIALFFILVGGFYGILYKIPAYRTFLDRIVKTFNKAPKVWLSAMVVVMALAVSICGLQYTIALFIPLMVSIILLMGYDKIVAALVTVGSIAAGLIGTTYSVTNLTILTTYLSLNFDYQIGVRFVILAVGIILVIFNTLMYIKKSSTNVKIERRASKKASEVKEEVVQVSKSSAKASSKKTTAKKSTKSTTKKSTNSKNSKSRKNPNKAALKDEDIIVVKESVSGDASLIPGTVNGKHKIWPFVCGFVFLFVLMVLAFVSWGEEGFGVKAFENAYTAVTEFTLFKFPIFAKILGTFNAFGQWGMTDMILPMAFVICVLAIVYKLSFNDILDGFTKGAKKALAPAVLVVLIYSLLVIATYHPFQLVIYKTILGWAKGFNIVLTTIVALLASVFNVDISYAFQSVVPYFTSLDIAKDSYPLAGIIFQAMYGLSILVAPTSVVLMSILSYLNISYREWLKKTWLLLVELFIVLLIVFIILAVI